MMMTAIYAMLVYLRAFLIARHPLALEAVALRQQLAVYKRRQPRPKLNGFDRLFWVVVRQIWTNWSEHSFSSSPKRWSLGIAPDTACSGSGDPDGGDKGGRR